MLESQPMASSSLATMRLMAAITEIEKGMRNLLPMAEMADYTFWHQVFSTE